MENFASLLYIPMGHKVVATRKNAKSQLKSGIKWFSSVFLKGLGQIVTNMSEIRVLRT